MALRSEVSGVVTFLLISASSQVREKKEGREREREKAQGTLNWSVAKCGFVTSVGRSDRSSARPTVLART